MPYYNKILTFFSASDNLRHAAEDTCRLSVNEMGFSEFAFISFAFSKLNFTKDERGRLKAGLRSFFKTWEKNERYQVQCLVFRYDALDRLTTFRFVSCFLSLRG